MNKIMVLIGLFLMCGISFAESCPTVKDIKANKTSGWTFYDSEENTQLSEKRTADFKKTIKQFALAEWTNTDHKTGVMHCYYRDNSGSTLDAFVGKNDFVPAKNTNYWYQVSGSMQCAAGSEKCAFQNDPVATQHQLALAKRPATLDRKIQELYQKFHALMY